MLRKTSMAVSLLLLLIFEILLPPATGTVYIRGKRQREVKLGENNVKFECTRRHANYPIRWCYDSNCSRSVDRCPGNSCTSAIDICNCTSSDKPSSKYLSFGPITKNMTGRSFYCRQEREKKVALKKVFLSHKSAVSIQGNRTKTLSPGRQVKFICDGTSVTAELIWYRYKNRTRQVLHCHEDKMGVCYGRNGSSSTLYVNSSGNVAYGRYYCHQVTPPIRHDTKSVMLKRHSTEEPFYEGPVYTIASSSAATTSPSFSSFVTHTADATTHSNPTPSSNWALSSTCCGSSDSSGPSVTTLTIAVNCAIAVCVLCIALLLFYRSRRPGCTLGYSNKANSVYEKKWEIKRSYLKMGDIIGQGYFGVVLKVETLKTVTGWTDRTVAVKIPHSRHSSDAVKSFTDEIQIMKMIPRHQNVIALVGVCSLNGPLWLVMEYAEHGCLLRHLRSLRVPGTLDLHILSCCDTKNEDRVLKEKTMWNFALQIVRGADHLLSHKCIHRDLAARNVLVCNGLVLKLCDFGMARDIHYTDYYRRTCPDVLPLKWCAPEAVVDKVYTEKSDVWSFGILLWEIATLGASPYPGIDSQCLIDLLTKDLYRMRCPGLCPTSLYSLMIRCWDAAPEVRPSFRVILEEICSGYEN